MTLARKKTGPAAQRGSGVTRTAPCSKSAARKQDARRLASQAVGPFAPQKDLHPRKGPRVCARWSFLLYFCFSFSFQGEQETASPAFDGSGFAESGLRAAFLTVLSSLPIK